MLLCPFSCSVSDIVELSGLAYASLVSPGFAEVSVLAYASLVSAGVVEVYVGGASYIFVSSSILKLAPAC